MSSISMSAPKKSPLFGFMLGMSSFLKGCLEKTQDMPSLPSKAVLKEQLVACIRFIRKARASANSLVPETREFYLILPSSLTRVTITSHTTGSDLYKQISEKNGIGSDFRLYFGGWGSVRFFVPIDHTILWSFLGEREKKETFECIVLLGRLRGGVGGSRTRRGTKKRENVNKKKKKQAELNEEIKEEEAKIPEIDREDDVAQLRQEHKNREKRISDELKTEKKLRELDLQERINTEIDGLPPGSLPLVTGVPRNRVDEARANLLTKQHNRVEKRIALNNYFEKNRRLEEDEELYAAIRFPPPPQLGAGDTQAILSDINDVLHDDGAPPAIDYVKITTRAPTTPPLSPVFPVRPFCPYVIPSAPPFPAADYDDNGSETGSDWTLTRRVKMLICCRSRRQRPSKATLLSEKRPDYGKESGQGLFAPMINSIVSEGKKMFVADLKRWMWTQGKETLWDVIARLALN